MVYTRGIHGKLISIRSRCGFADIGVYIYIGEFFTTTLTASPTVYLPALISHQFSSFLRQVLRSHTKITMNILASQQLDQPAKGLSLKWTREDIEVITNWLIVEDTNGERFLQY